PVLAGLGMAGAFDPSTADFSGMTGGRDLFVSDVVHKAFVRVDETGTEAAAATGVIMALTAMPQDQPVQFVLDRPFLFLIIDDLTGTVLFMGRMADPTA
ncbi:MAG TPA: serpin family protein, partial [Candidatus Fermentibacter sp.]|nr:serpin family protein [Candidatus Fermentibacter sp.]